MNPGGLTGPDQFCLTYVPIDPIAVQNYLISLLIVSFCCNVNNFNPSKLTSPLFKLSMSPPALLTSFLT